MSQHDEPHTSRCACLECVPPHIPKPEAVNHPAHYGGADNPYEAIKVIEAWGCGFHLGNALKYIARAKRKDATLDDLKKARWYLDRAISNYERDKQL